MRPTRQDTSLCRVTSLASRESYRQIHPLRKRGLSVHWDEAIGKLSFLEFGQ